MFTPYRKVKFSLLTFLQAVLKILHNVNSPEETRMVVGNTGAGIIYFFNNQ